MHSLGRILSLACLLAFAGAGPASAARPIITPGIESAGVLECLLLNSTPVPMDGVLIELIDQDGDLRVAAGPLTAFPNDERTLVWQTFSAGYCRVSRASGPLSSKTTKVTYQQASFWGDFDPEGPGYVGAVSAR